MDIISIQEISKTKTFEKMSAIQKQFIGKRNNREKINHALVVYVNTGYLDESIGGLYSKIVKELAFNKKPSQ
jgi:hypothetical protein